MHKDKVDISENKNQQVSKLSINTDVSGVVRLILSPLHNRNNTRKAEPNKFILEGPGKNQPKQYIYNYLETT